MQIFNTLKQWVDFRNTFEQERTLGFVPTMGNLHMGHRSLFVTSVSENDYTVTSVFVNPTQFNQLDDFLHYPRSLDADIALMSDAGVDFCIIPEESEIYADNFTYQIHEKTLCQLMEGAHRPGHFDGVLTVVMKLLNLTRPTRAYFGEKDYQQYLLLLGMAKALFLQTEIKSCPTVREPSGLAYSSRNNRLSPEQKKRAEVFATLFHEGSSCAMIKEALITQGITVEYIEEYQGRRFAAVVIDGIRLIDNYALS